MDFKYLFFDFDGRIDRGQWWIGFGLLLVAQFLNWVLFGGGLVARILAVVIFVAALGLHVKRFQDRSGWWVLVFFIPVIGFIWMVIEMGFLEGDEGANEYGPPAARA